MGNKAPAIVFGLFETGLGVIRSLGMNGIPVIGLDFKKDIGWYSKYVQPLMCPSPSEEERLTSWLFDNFKGRQEKYPIFITSDDFLNYISRNREILSDVFIIDIPNHNLIISLTDKYEQFKLARSAGISVPETWLIRNVSDLQTLIDSDKGFPLFMKGLDVNSWRRHFGGSKKGFILSSNDQLLSQVKDINISVTPLIVQELIEGADVTHFKYCAYIDQQGSFLAEFMLQKIRQYPIHFGVGSAVKSIYNPFLLEEGRKLFQHINFKGVGSAEFKWDAKKNRFTLIELNPRYWQQNYLTTFCGLNFPLLQYERLMGGALNKVSAYDVGKFWVNRYMDFSSFLDYRKGEGLGFFEWRRSVWGKKVYPDFSWNDPLPFFYEFGFGKKLLRIPHFIFKRIFR